MSENKQKTKNYKPIPCKVILVGDSGVGKTCIINSYIDENKENTLATLSTSYYNKIEIIKDYKILFQIWDTVGQEQFRSINSLFFKDAQICLMVYDITREASFKSIKEYWYESVVNNGLDNVIFGIAGNKSDIYMNEKVDRDEVKEFCTDINAAFHFTSAKENNCINDLFRQLGEKFVNSNFMLEIGNEYFINNRNNSYNSFKITQNDKTKKHKGCC